MELQVQTASTLFERELAKLIDARMEDLKDEISAGMLADISEYKSKCGMREGLKAALELMPEARRLSDQSNR